MIVSQVQPSHCMHDVKVRLGRCLSIGLGPCLLARACSVLSWDIISASAADRWYLSPGWVDLIQPFDTWVFLIVIARGGAGTASAIDQMWPAWQLFFWIISIHSIYSTRCWKLPSFTMIAHTTAYSLATHSLSPE